MKDVDQIDSKPPPCPGPATNRPPLRIHDPEKESPFSPMMPTPAFDDDDQTLTVAHGLVALIQGVLLLSGLVAALAVFVLACHFLVWAIG